jgi:hypothetical protein
LLPYSVLEQSDEIIVEFWIEALVSQPFWVLDEMPRLPTSCWSWGMHIFNEAN